MVRLSYWTLIIWILSGSYAFSADFGPVKKAFEAQGEWQKGIVLDRKVIFTNKNRAASKIMFEVPQEGDYQLYVYVYHNWRKYSPFIFFEAKDAKGAVHKGYMFLEHCWYLGSEDKGRWLIHSPSAEPFWHLSRGRLFLRFWVQGMSSMWSDREVEMEDIVAIENFFLAPVITKNGNPVSLELIDPEFGSGSCNAVSYSPGYAAGLIEAPAFSCSSHSDVEVPFSGSYVGVISMHTQNPYKAEVSFSSNDFKNQVTIGQDTRRPFWESKVFGPVFLKAGKYDLGFKNVSVKSWVPSEILVDYVILIPFIRNTNRACR